MLSVFVCEDDISQQAQIVKYIKNHIVIEDLQMEFAYAATKPDEILDYLKNAGQITGLYFLDLDLKCDMDGLQLAEAIRKYDPRAFIVFITADAESHALTFKFKIEAMDYIVKRASNLETLEPRICECINNAFEKYTAKKNSVLQNNFVFNITKNKVISINCDEIMFFEASKNMPHHITLFTHDNKYEFRSSLRDIEKNLNKAFFRCHRAYIVNMKKVGGIDKDYCKLRLVNGEEIEIADKHLKKTEKLIKELP